MASELTFTAQQAAAITGIPLQTLKNAVSGRQLKGAIRTKGGRPRLDRAGLLAYGITHLLAPRVRFPLKKIYDAIKADPDMKPQEIAPGVTLDVRKAAEPILERLDAYERAAAQYIKADPAIMGGAPCIAGTRIPAHMIAMWIDNGTTVAEVVELYPNLRPEQVEAACLYAGANPLKGRAAGS
jgi:uncharacterized protein (DUF433 family)